MSTTLLIDYGAGNLRSVANALHSLDAPVLTVSNGASFPERPSRIILPGVGSFGDSMNELVARGLDEPIRRAIHEGVPFLGICVGYQLLFEESEESPGVAGLCLLPGKVRKFSPGKIPTWVGMPFALPTAITPCWAGMSEEPYFYYVHSYYPVPSDESIIAATTDYQESFAAAVIQDKLWAVQFHPEKSQDCGIQLLKNFLNLA